MASELAKEDDLIFLCGHYEGFDERIREHIDCEEISIGDFVLTGGELPSLCLIDSISRNLEGTLGKIESAQGDSFCDDLLEYLFGSQPNQSLSQLNEEWTGEAELSDIARILLLTGVTSLEVKNDARLSNGDMTIGAIMYHIMLFNNVTAPTRQLHRIYDDFNDALIYANGFFEIIDDGDKETEKSGKYRPEKIKGELELRNVDFTYPNGTKALHNINMKIESGKITAFVGLSGAGKSTLANLLIGFIRPTSGRILLDGKDMNEIDLRTYRQHISVVTQETLLFDATIRDNICYGITPDENTLNNVIKDADLEAFIDSLPDGLNTKIQENGVRLSGGQKQRIAIARALLRNPKVLILDEATSALDVETEADIKNALERLIDGRTTFIIAHRLSTIHNANRIVVMHNGRIAEIGTHADLIKNNGIYADMNRKYAEATQI